MLPVKAKVRIDNRATLKKPEANVSQISNSLRCLNEITTKTRVTEIAMNKFGLWTPPGSSIWRHPKDPEVELN